MIYGYVRVSTDKQCTENQRFEILRFASARGIIIESWIEEIVSGSKKIPNRKLGKLYRSMKKGDWIITSELSRLGRNLMHIMSFLHICMEREVVVHTIKEGYELGNNLNSKILAFAFSLSAEIERNLISQRTKEALARKKKEGIVLGRPRGRKASTYKLNGKDKYVQKLISEEYSLGDMCVKLKVSRNTLRPFIKQMGYEDLFKERQTAAIKKEKEEEEEGKKKEVRKRGRPTLAEQKEREKQMAAANKDKEEPKKKAKRKTKRKKKKKKSKD